MNRAWNRSSKETIEKIASIQLRQIPGQKNHDSRYRGRLLKSAQNSNFSFSLAYGVDYNLF